SFDFPPQGEHARQHTEALTLGEDVEVSAVLQYILTGRFDPGPKPAEALEPSLAKAPDTGLGAPCETRRENRAAGSRPALTRNEDESATAGDKTDPPWEHSPAPALPLSGATSTTTSAILPGGAQLSSVEAGRRGYFRSLAQIGGQVAGGLAYAHARGI